MSTTTQQLLRTTHLPTRIADHFSQQIRSGELKPGDRLPTELEMSKNFGVSRSVVREAVARLRSEGLIQSRQGLGAFVIDRPTRHIRLEEGDMSQDDFRGLFQLRVPLEIEAAGLAARNHAPIHLEQMDKAMLRMSAKGSEPNDGILADLDFHRTIALATGNDYFVQFLGAISDCILKTILASREKTHLDTLTEIVTREHAELRDAIASGDSARARAAMRAHMKGSTERVDLDVEFYG